MKQQPSKIASNKTLWFPEAYQVFVQHNPNYLKSVFIGLTNPIWLLPTMILVLIVIPLCKGILAITIYWIKTPIYGLSGKLVGLPTPKPDIAVYVNGQKRN